MTLEDEFTILIEEARQGFGWTQNGKMMVARLQFFEERVKQLMSAQVQRIQEKIRELKTRFKCAACDGAKCEHTQCCVALEIVKKETL